MVQQALEALAKKGCIEVRFKARELERHSAKNCVCNAYSSTIRERTNQDGRQKY
jgi:hypothetical protein